MGACFDADRLNLWRVGHEPDPALLSTPTARRPETIRWGRALSASYCRAVAWDRLGGHVEPLQRWPELVAAYATLSPARA